MVKTSIRRWVIACTILAGSACGHSPKTKTVPRTPQVSHQTPEPCWVKSPDCRQDDTQALFFVGQNEAPTPSWGKPSRAAIRSAQQDAEQQYARYLSVDIQSSLFMKRLFNDGVAESEFKHTVTSTAERTVSQVRTIDQHFVAHSETVDGQPLWTVYVLIKIEKDAVESHQAAIAVEAKEKAQEAAQRAQRERKEAERKAQREKEQQAAAQRESERNAAEAAQAPDTWTAELSNIDDSVSIYVNNTKVHECGFSDSCTVDLSRHFIHGNNIVRLEFENLIGPWTYGYEILKNQKLMYQGRCGQVWVYGCKYFDTEVGISHRFEFQTEYPKQHGGPS